VYRGNTCEYMAPDVFVTAGDGHEVVGVPVTVTLSDGFVFRDLFDWRVSYGNTWTGVTQTEGIVFLIIKPLATPTGGSISCVAGDLTASATIEVSQATLPARGCVNA